MRPQCIPATLMMIYFLAAGRWGPVGRARLLAGVPDALCPYDRVDRCRRRSPWPRRPRRRSPRPPAQPPRPRRRAVHQCYDGVAELGPAGGIDRLARQRRLPHRLARRGGRPRSPAAAPPTARRRSAADQGQPRTRRAASPTPRASRPRSGSTSASTATSTAGTGADGIVFFLAASDPNNATASPLTLGPRGGYLGYSAETTTSPTPVPGLTHAYLGVGLDVFGNFTNGELGARVGCDESRRALVTAGVTVRGPGNGTERLLPAEHRCCRRPARTATTPAAAVPVEVAINPTGTALTAAGGFTVPARLLGGAGHPGRRRHARPESGLLPNGDRATCPTPSWVNAQRRAAAAQLRLVGHHRRGDRLPHHCRRQGPDSQRHAAGPVRVAHRQQRRHRPGRRDRRPTPRTAAVQDVDETRTITLSDTFPAGLTPQSTGPAAPAGPAPSPTRPSAARTRRPAPIGTLADRGHAGAGDRQRLGAQSPLTLSDTVTVGSPDATQGTDDRRPDLRLDAGTDGRRTPTRRPLARTPRGPTRPC